MEVDDEWELLSDDGGFLQISDDSSASASASASAAANQIYSVFHTNYFICPSPPQFVETTADRDQHQPIQINIDSFSGGGVDRDPISQVFFKKMKEAEFVDFKVDSANYQLEEKADPRKEMAIEKEKENEKEKEVGMGYGGDLEDDGGNMWKWRLSGIGGAICSFGVAAATFCIIVFTKHPHRNHKLHFRIYTDDHHRDKRMKVKGAIAAVSGVPINININRARITVGGYYDHDADAPPPLSI